jgi:hypothetical protein
MFRNKKVEFDEPQATYLGRKDPSNLGAAPNCIFVPSKEVIR